MKVLITGASGRVGSAVARHLHSNGFELRLTDRKIRKDLPVRLEVTNLLDRDGVYRVLDGCDAVIHMGNHPTYREEADAQQIYAENCAMNVNVFQAARELGLKKVVFVSSIQVINGDRKYRDKQPIPPSFLPYLPLDSDTPANARNPYSLSKLAGEQYLAGFVAPAGVQTVAVRLPWTCSAEWWGWFHHHNWAPKKVRDHHLADEAFAYLHADDASELFAAVLRTDLPGHRVYLPAAKNIMVDVPLPELYDKFFANVPLRKPLAELTGFVDTSKITADTGWTPKRYVGEPAQG